MSWNLMSVTNTDLMRQYLQLKNSIEDLTENNYLIKPSPGAIGRKVIKQNNFIDNEHQALFRLPIFGYKSISWKQNYWGKPRNLPYFILWWFTAGARLIILALKFAALAGVIFMFICHVWMDYVWLTSVAHFAKKGTNALGLKWYRSLMAIFGAVLIYFGLTFIINALVV